MESASGDEPHSSPGASLFDQLFRHAPFPQVLVDPEQGTVLRASPAACDLLQGPGEDLEGVPLADLFPEPEDDLAEFLDRLTREWSASLRARIPPARVLELRGTALETGEGTRVHIALQDVSAETELTAARGFRESLVEHFPDAVFLKDRQGVYETFNAEFLRRLGRDHDEVLGVRDREVVPPELVEHCTATDRKVLTEERPYVTERWLQRDSGEWTLLQILKLPYRDTDGHLHGVIGVCRDVTEHHHTERRLRTSEHQLREILEASPEGLWMGDFESLETVEVNGALCEMLGRSREELLGTRPDEWIEPADRPAFWEEATRRREAQTRRYEISLLTQAGDRVPVVANVSTSYDPEGAPRYSVAFVTDITHLKETERSLQRVADILEAFPGPVMLCSTDFKVLYQNRFARETLGDYQPGTTPVSALAGDHTAHEILQRQAVPTAREDGSWTGEVSLLDRTGRERPFLMTVLAHPESDGQVERLSAVGVDIAGEKEAEAREKHYLEQLNRVSRLISMGELVSVLSHQLNQPLTALSNYATAGTQLLAQKSAMPSQIQELLEGMGSEAQKASGILTHIRSFLKGQAPDLRPLEVNPLIRELVPFICTGHSGKVPPIELDLDEDLPPVKADGIQLQEAVFNLARNGIESCRERNPESPGPLILRTRRTEEGAEIRVIDHGTGLPDGLDLEALEPFFTTKEKGLGLGLWIVKSIVQSHGGRLDAWNHPDRPGATFRIALPAAA
ncbi:MAG: PAS domain S-box protein [Thiohalorhabdus sp.]